MTKSNVEGGYLENGVGHFVHSLVMPKLSRVSVVWKCARMEKPSIFQECGYLVHTTLATATCANAQLHFGSREKRAVLVMAILQVGAQIGGTLIKGINALVDAKRGKSFNKSIKMVTANVELTQQRLMTLENKTSMMAKAIMPALDDLKSRIAN